MATQLQVYNIPVVFHDLREIEYQYQLFDALENLERLVDDVFGRITNRVVEEKKKIDAIQSRIESATNKVHAISGSHKGTTVLSAAKYPASKYLPDYIPLYADRVQQPPYVSRYHLSEEPHLPAETTPRDPMLEDPYLPESTRPAIQAREDVREGLGRLPSDLTSTASLLLFNSSENPYKKYVALDTLSRAPTAAGPAGDEDDKGLDLTEAPQTISVGDQLPSIGAVDYIFKPSMGAVPVFQNLPSVLPELGMVAENINWGKNSVPEFTPIAPSSLSHLSSSVSAALPDIVPEPSAAQPKSTPPPPTGSSTPPPPSGGPPPPTDAPPPPSGGPPPPIDAPPPPSGAPPAPKDVPPVVSNPDGGRSNLLADIRQGHKGRLKKVKTDSKLGDAPPSVKNAGRKKKTTGEGGGGEKEDGPPVSTGNIFGDLIAALSRRQASLRGETEPVRPKKSSGASAEHIDMPDPNQPSAEEAEWSEKAEGQDD